MICDGGYFTFSFGVALCFLSRRFSVPRISAAVATAQLTTVFRKRGLRFYNRSQPQKLVSGTVLQNKIKMKRKGKRFFTEHLKRTLSTQRRIWTSEG